MYDNIHSFLGSSDKFEKASRYILLALTFLLPIFLIPVAIFPLSFGKLALISIATILSFVLWIISRFKAGNIQLPKHLVFYSTTLILLFGLISTLFSGAIIESFIGSAGETNTLFFILTLFILLLVSFKVFNSPQKVLNFYFILFVSSIILIIYQLLRFFLGADFLDFGVLNRTTSTLLGKWNDLGILFGLSSIISVTTLEFFKPTKSLKIFIYVLAVLSLVMVAIVNSTLIWSVLAAVSLLLFVYLFFQNRKEEIPGMFQKGGKFSKFSAIVFILSVLAIFFGTQIGFFLSNKYNISQIEARPSLTSTLSVAKETLSKRPGFGAGYNRFDIEWGLNKPNRVNNTIFWNANFNYGVGIIPTFLVTNGILGLFAWLVFIAAIILLGIKAIFHNIEDRTSKYVIISSFLASLYLWTFSFIYVPGAVILGLTFMMTGIFLASVANLGFIQHKKISFLDDSQTGFVSVFSLVVILIAVIGFGGMISSRYISSVYALKSIREVNQNNLLDRGLKDLERAVFFAKTDSNYLLLSQVHIARLNRLLNNQDLSGTEEGANLFQEILREAVLNAQKATQLDEDDHRNWLALGNIYESIIPLGIQGAYESAKSTYQRAQEANPTNPSVDLALARLEMVRGDNNAARQKISDALQKKNNYTEAIFLLSQIEINEGNLPQATQAVETASIINPNNFVIFFQLGYLKFIQEDFGGSIKALERAIELNPPYSNAKYFLGLSYYNMGENNEAIKQFEEIQELNPDNREVKLIIENLKNGNQPFLNIDNSDPETRQELPVEGA